MKMFLDKKMRYKIKYKIKQDHDALQIPPPVALSRRCPLSCRTVRYNQYDVSYIGFLFCKSFPLHPFLFFFRTGYMISQTVYCYY